MKRIIILLMAIAAVTAVSCEGLDREQASTYSIKMKTLDVANSQCVYLTQAKAVKSEESRGQLLKIDENGNVAAVIFTCVDTETTEGSSSQTITERTDLSIIPSRMYTIADKYIVMKDCRVIDSNGNLSRANDTHIYDEENGEVKVIDMSYKSVIIRTYNDMDDALDILVRISDGKMFYIPQEAADKYFSPHSDGTMPDGTEKYKTTSHLDKDGTLYLTCNYYAASIKEDGDNLIVKPINPQGIILDDAIPLSNGTVFGESYENYYFFYPDGSVDVIDHDDPSEFWDEHFSMTALNGRMKAIRTYMTLGERTGGGDWEISYKVVLCDVNVGTTRGSWAFRDELASYTSALSADEYSYPNYHIGSNSLSAKIYETSSAYILEDLFKWDKKSTELELFTYEFSNQIIAPSPYNTYNGKSWMVGFSEGQVGSVWFDMETLTTGSKEYDIANDLGGFVMTSFKASIPTGEAYMSGIRLEDAKEILVTYKIESGEVSYVEVDKDIEIVTLLPMN